MGIFSKRCSVCGRKLPDKRKFKGVCDTCGMTYKSLKKQMEDTLTLVEGAKTAVTGYNRCLFGLRLVERLSPYSRAGLYTFPQKTAEAQAEYFKKRAVFYIGQIREANEKKKYDRKIGVAPLSHYKAYQNPSIKTTEGSCKGCWEVKPLNKAGYCFDCLVRATTVTAQDLAAYALTHETKDLSREEIIEAAIRLKLKREAKDAGL